MLIDHALRFDKYNIWSWIISKIKTDSVKDYNNYFNHIWLDINKTGKYKGNWI